MSAVKFEPIDEPWLFRQSREHFWRSQLRRAAGFVCRDVRGHERRSHELRELWARLPGRGVSDGCLPACDTRIRPVRSNSPRGGRDERLLG
jgi:hypothetical protein